MVEFITYPVQVDCFIKVLVSFLELEKTHVNVAPVVEVFGVRPIQSFNCLVEIFDRLLKLLEIIKG